MKNALALGFIVMIFISIYLKDKSCILEDENAKLNNRVQNLINILELPDSIDYKCPRCGFEVKLMCN